MTDPDDSPVPSHFAATWNHAKDLLRELAYELRRDNVALLSGGVAFFSLLALIPALAVVVSIYGIVADPDDIEQQIEDVTEALPEEASTLLDDQLDRIVAESPGNLTVTAVLSLAIALWSASSGMKHLITAVTAAYDEEETRGFLRTRGLALGLTFGAVLFLVVAFVIITLLPTLLSHAGAGEGARVMLSVLRWPLLALAMMVALAVIYRFGPDRDAPHWRWSSPGAAAATLLWLGASGCFSLYASHFGSYNEVYGSLGAVVVLMLWLFLTAFSVIMGAELNAELERHAEAQSS